MKGFLLIINRKRQSSHIYVLIDIYSLFLIISMCFTDITIIWRELNKQTLDCHFHSSFWIRIQKSQIFAVPANFPFFTHHYLDPKSIVFKYSVLYTRSTDAEQRRNSRVQLRSAHKPVWESMNLISLFIPSWQNEQSLKWMQRGQTLRMMSMSWLSQLTLHLFLIP